MYIELVISDCASLSASLTFLYSYVEKLDKKIDAISQHLASTASSFSSQAVKTVDNDLRTGAKEIRLVGRAEEGTSQYLHSTNRIVETGL